MVKPCALGRDTPPAGILWVTLSTFVACVLLDRLHLLFGHQRRGVAWFNLGLTLVLVAVSQSGAVGAGAHQFSQLLETAPGLVVCEGERDGAASLLNTACISLGGILVLDLIVAATTMVCNPPSVE